MPQYFQLSLPDLAAINAGNTGNPIGIHIQNQDLAAIINNLAISVSSLGAALGLGFGRVRIAGAEWTVATDPSNSSNNLYTCDPGGLLLDGMIVFVPATSLSIPAATPNIIPLWVIDITPDSGEPHTLTDGVTTHVVRAIVTATAVADDPTVLTSAIPYNEVKDILQGEWINLAVDSLWYEAVPVQYKKIGKQVFLRGAIYPNAALNPSNPMEYFPIELPLEIVPKYTRPYLCFGFYPTFLGVPPQIDYNSEVVVYVQNFAQGRRIGVIRQYDNTGFSVHYDKGVYFENISYWLD